MKDNIIEFCRINDIDNLECSHKGTEYLYENLQNNKYAIVVNGVIDHCKHKEKELTSIGAYQKCLVYLKTNRDALKTKSRKREIVFKRQLIHWALRELSNRGIINMTLAEIGKMAGDKDHTTVIHGIKTINNLIETRHENINNISQKLIKLFMKEATIFELTKGDKIKTSFNSGSDFVEKINTKEKKVFLKSSKMWVKSNDRGLFIIFK